MNKLKLFTLALLFFLSACNSVYKNAKSYYETKDYVQAVQIIVANKDDPPTQEKIALIKDSVVSLDKAIYKADKSKLDELVELYKKLLTISETIKNTPYQNASPLLSTYYKNINYLIADAYYKHGKSLFPETANDYRIQVDTFTKGMKYYSLHTELQNGLANARKQYAITSADENYTLAKEALKENDYKKASYYLANVIQSYKNYGNYKDANKLFAKYDPIWRKQQASNDYDQATTLLKTASNYNDYREVARLYQAAANINNAYGGFKNSQQLATKYENMWQAQEAEALYASAKELADNATTHADHRNAAIKFQQLNAKYPNYRNSAALANEQNKLGYIYIHFKPNNSGDNSNLNSLISRQVEAIFDRDEFKIDNNQQSDFFISIIYIEDAKDHKKILSADEYRDTNYAYIEIKERITRTYVFKAAIRVGGKINYDQDFTVRKESELIHTFYKGNPPGWKTEKKNGTNLTLWGNNLKSADELALEARNDIEKALTENLNNIKRQAQRSL